MKYELPEKYFICPERKTGRSHYAMNPNCRPDSPADTVLLFESKEGWNQFGGAELITTERHEGAGSNILFNDLHVSFVRTKELGELNWGDND